jgi:formylglycine-generating enzyme required for sulfatase activity
MARLDHPNIIAVHDFGRTTEGHLFFVMDFINGATLHELIRSRELVPAEAVRMVEQVCDALAYAHEEGVIHRDIKPANVMVDRRGRVKVADFGLARVIERSGEEFDTTGTGVVLGTPNYMAPEQKCGLRVDHRADIYSVGVMLYEALAGQVPHGRFEPLSKRAGFDQRLDAIIDKALAQEPEDRFQSSLEMKAALESVRLSLLNAPLVIKRPGSTGVEFTASGVNAPLGKKLLLYVFGAVAALAIAAVLLAKRQPASVASDATQSRRSPQPTTAAHGSRISPEAATKEKPFVNSLGMEFVPVPGTALLMSRMETKVRDFEAYATESGYQQSGGATVMKVSPNAEWGYAIQWEVDANASWEQPGFSQSADHPVTCVSWDEARAFCEWLSRKESRQYRLPSDSEWSAAAGSSKYPWGDEWPPPRGAGNLRDAAFANSLPRSKYASSWDFERGYNDGAARTASAPSSAANLRGIHDLSGNVSEWCEDEYKENMNSAEALMTTPALRNERAGNGIPNRVVRGGAWHYNKELQLRSSYRFPTYPRERFDSRGFRCVLEVSVASYAAPASATAALETAKPPPLAKPKVTLREAVEWVLSIEGQLSIRANGLETVTQDMAVALRPSTEIIGVSFESASHTAKLRADDLQRLTAFTKLRRIYVAKLTVNDAALSFLAELPELDSIHLFHCGNVSDGLVEHLRKNTSFKKLICTNSRMEGKSLHLLPHLYQLGLGDSLVSNDALGAISKLKGLTKLTLEGSQITDAGMPELARLTELRELNVARTRVTLKGLRLLKPLSKIERFGLHSELPDYAAVAQEIANLFPKLFNVTVVGKNITAEHLSSLRAVEGLTSIEAFDSTFAPGALAGLSELPRLERFYIRTGTNVTDDLTLPLGHLTTLRELRLDDTKITDATLQHLEPLKNLTTLTVTRTKVTPDGIAAFEKSHPGCRVTR